MADSFKDIIITPNRGSSTADPKIEFRGGNSTTDTTITIQTYPTSNGTLSFEGSSGQLFSITNDMNGTIFAVNDVSGIPSIEVLDTGLIKLGEFNGSVAINTSTALSGYSLTVGGNANISGNLVVSGTINATIQGSITTATNLTGGAVGRIPIQSGVGATSFIPTGTSGQLLQYGTNTATWVSTSSLTVAGAATAQVANTVLAGQRTTNATHYLTFVDSNDASPTADSIYTTSSFVINPSTGNVGLGITSPGSKLDVDSSGAGIANVTLRGPSSDNNWAGGIRFISNNGTSVTSQIRSSANGMFFDFGGSERIRIDSAGNLGIGTSSPTSLLHVAGNSLITGITTVTNTTQATSTTTGALQVSGGVGIGGNLHVGGEIVANKLTIQLTTVTTTLIETDDIIKTTNVTQATATATGALQIAGGASVGGNLWVGGNIIGNVAATVSTATNANNVATVARTNNATHNLVFVDSNNASATFEALYTTSSFTVNPSTGKVDVGGTLTSTRDGSNTLIVYNSNATSSVGAGGITFKKNILLSSFVTFNEYASIAVEDSSGTTQGAIRFYKGDVGTYLGIQLDTFAGSTASSVLLATQNFVAVQTTSQATSTVTGALRVKGGVGIGGDLYVGGSIVGAVPTATNATNIVGGAAGRIPIQSGAGATSFVPTGSNGQVLTWSGTTATWATPAGGSTVETTARTTNANHFITFVDSNNASATAETVYTTSTFTINPSNGNVVIPGELTAGGTITSGQGVSTGDASFELGYYRTGAGHAYVDFHSTASTDFEARIIRYAGVNGGMDIINNGTGGMVLSVEGSAPMVFKTVATERMRIDSAGNVGVGPSTVRAQQHVFGLGQTTAALTDAGNRGGMLRVSDNNSAAGSGGAILFANSQGDTANSVGFAAIKGILSNGSSNTIGDLAFSTRQAVADTALAERMRITSSGNVGIGTNNPGSKLDVNGNTNITGDLSVSGTILATVQTATNALNFDGVSSLTRSASHRANTNITGGGVITVDASSNVLWATRFIVISNGRGSYFSTSGYFDINCPTSGTITGVGGASNKTATAAGIPLANWEALYYILPIGSSNASIAANFRVSLYTADVDIPHNWVLICVKNGDTGRVYFNNGYSLKPGQSINVDTYDAERSETADTLTTARSIGLSGDVSGSASFNGSADITITATVANDSHDHTVIEPKAAQAAESTSSRTVIDSGIYTFNTTNASLGNSTPVAYWSTIAWGNGAAGSAELAADWTSNGNNLWYRSLRDTVDNWWPWKRIFTDEYHPNADTLTTARSINGTSFNGSADITTANWGTARTLTIGATGKSVNGSGNVSWSLTEIGAPSTTGTGASGTWGINITGSAPYVSRTVAADGFAVLAEATIGTNDFFRIGVGGAANAGYAEIATADDGTEPIYVRQYTGVFTTLARTATLLDGSGNTSFPGNVTAGGGLYGGNLYLSAEINLTGAGTKYIDANGSLMIRYSDDSTFYTNRLLVDSNGSVSSYGDFRAPIFYDSNDTSVRWDAGIFVLRSTSPTIYFRDTDANSAMIHVNANTFYVLRGGNDSETWTPVNSQWPLSIDLTNNNMVFGGVATAITDMRAPIFYDSNDTAYLINPNSSSRLSSIVVGAGDSFIYEPNTNYLGVRTGPSTAYKYFRFDTNGYFYTLNGGMIAETGDMRAPIYYDFNNTGYYVDPTGTTSVRIAGDIRSDSGAWTGESAGKIQYHANNWYLQFSNALLGRNASGGDVFTVMSSGQVTASADFRSQLFYDSNDTTYYLNPNGTSVLYNMELINLRCGFDRSWDNYPGIAVRNTTDQGPQGEFRIHGISGASGGDFAVTLRVDGAGVFYGDFYAPIYYDYNNSARYLDPNGDSYVQGNFYIARNGASNNVFGGLEIRENTYAGAGDGEAQDAPGINFHWAARTAARIYLNSGGAFVLGGQDDITNNRRTLFCADLNATGNVTAYYSDERLKTKLGNIDNAIDIIKSLNGFRYVNNDVAKQHGYDSDRVQLGISAQEVEVVLPEIVDLAAFDIDVNSPEKKSKTGENYKTVQYDRLVPVLIEAVKEQQEIIDEQNAKINMLEEKLNSIISLLGEK